MKHLTKFSPDLTIASGFGYSFLQTEDVDYS